MIVSANLIPPKMGKQVAQGCRTGAQPRRGQNRDWHRRRFQNRSQHCPSILWGIVPTSQFSDAQRGLWSRLLQVFPQKISPALVTDVISRLALEAAVATAIERFGRLDIVVSNAETSATSSIENFQDSAEARIPSVNLAALIMWGHAVVPLP